MKSRCVRVKLLKHGIMPVRSTEGAVGYDLAATHSTLIPARSFALVRTGVSLALPRQLEAQIRPRSGLAASHGIGVLNSPGTIDPDYRGELKVILFNFSDQDYQVRRGERIAQLVFQQVAMVRLQRASDLSATKRGRRGLGSTG